MFVIFNLFQGLSFSINTNFININKFILNNRQIILSINNKLNFSNLDNKNLSLLNKKDLNNNFPSFYKFIQQREEEKKRDLKNNKQYFMESSSKDLKLLQYISALQWSKNWIYEMIHLENNFPKFMFQDMYRMREFGVKQTVAKISFILVIFHLTQI